MVAREQALALARTADGFALLLLRSRGALCDSSSGHEPFPLLSPAFWSVRGARS